MEIDIVHYLLTQLLRGASVQALLRHVNRLHFEFLLAGTTFSRCNIKLQPSFFYWVGRNMSSLWPATTAWHFVACATGGLWYPVHQIFMRCLSTDSSKPPCWCWVMLNDNCGPVAGHDLRLFAVHVNSEKTKNGSLELQIFKTNPTKDERTMTNKQTKKQTNFYFAFPSIIYKFTLLDL